MLTTCKVHNYEVIRDHEKNILKYKRTNQKYYRACKFANVSDMIKYIDKLEVKINKEVEEKALKKLKNDEERTKLLDSLKVGTILVRSWGYEQTNIDFYIVRDKKGCKFRIQQLGKIYNYKDGYSDMSAYVTPNLESLGAMSTVYVRSFYLKIGGYHAEIWDGKEKYKQYGYANECCESIEEEY